MTRASDYPPPGYAGYCWSAQGKLFLQRGSGLQVFADTPDGLNAFRMALLALADSPSELTGQGNVSGPSPVKRFTASGKVKLSMEDLWEEPSECASE